MTQDGPVEAYIAHTSPGRLRLKLPARKHRYDYFAALADAAMALDGVVEVRANPLTASLLVLHERGDANDTGHADGRAIAHALEDAGHIELVSPSYLMPAEPASGDRISVEGMFLAGLFLLGVVQLLRGQALAPAATMFWMASELARHRAAATDSRDG